MKKSIVETFIGKRVKVTLWDGEEIIGEFYKTGMEKFKNMPNLYLSKGWFFCINPQSCLFRSSHIRCLKNAV